MRVLSPREATSFLSHNVMPIARDMYELPGTRIEAGISCVPDRLDFFRIDVEMGGEYVVTLSVWPHGRRLALESLCDALISGVRAAWISLHGCTPPAIPRWFDG